MRIKHIVLILSLSIFQFSQAQLQIKDLLGTWELEKRVSSLDGIEPIYENPDQKKNEQFKPKKKKQKSFYNSEKEEL